MSEIFLSASIPVKGRGDFYKTADNYLIQCAVREFVITALGRRKIIFGGHPSITPMIWIICEDLGVNFTDCVVLYQSSIFEDCFPEENKHFDNVCFIDGVPYSATEEQQPNNVVYKNGIAYNRQASLLKMRGAMLSRPDLSAAVFIGGMDGVLDEYDLFNHYHRQATVLAVAATGGAASQLAEQLITSDSVNLHSIDFSSLFYNGLGIDPREKREL